MADYNGDANNNSYDAFNVYEVNYLYGYGGNDSLYGGFLYDYISGGDGNDYLVGRDGSDTLVCGAGNDTALGGDGADRIYMTAGDVSDTNTAYGDSGDDVFYAGPGKDAIVGGQGQDLVSYTYSTAGVVVDLARGTGAGGADGDSYRSVEDITGSNYDDRLIGNGAFNELLGDIGNDVIRGGAGGDYLDGGSGIDTLDYRTSDAGVVINLATGAASGGDAQGDEFRFFENVSGSDFADFLTGDSGANVLNGYGGNDRLYGQDGADVLRGLDGNDLVSGGAGDDGVHGGNGNDILWGGAGVDLLKGNAGADRFQFRLTSESGLGPLRDTIGDFSRAEGDRVDLAAIDANTAASGNQAFTFIGTAGFHGVSGELRYAVKAGDAVVVGDVNGDGVADFAILVADVPALKAGDFLL